MSFGDELELFTRDFVPNPEFVEMGQRISALEARIAALESVIQFGDGGVTIRSSRLKIRAEQKLEMSTANGSIIIEPASMTIVASGVMSVASPRVEANVALVAFNTAEVRCTGVLRSDTLITNTVVASTYTPGAGNVW